MSDISMRILLSAQDQASGVMKGLGNSFKDITFGMRNLSTEGNIGTGALTQGFTGVGNAMWAVAGAATLVGAAVAIGVGVQSVKAAGDFQSAMLQNEAHAGLVKSQVDNVTKALLEMGPAVGQSPTVLAQALYPVLSSLSGITDQSAKTQVSLTELKMASESVAGTTTSVTSVTNAASAAFNAYSLGTNNTSQNISHMNGLFDAMNATVSAGNMQWDTYSRMIGKLSVASHAAGVSFNEENAALATLTNSGYSAQNAGTNLANLFTQLDLKTDSLAKNAAKLGVNFDEQKFKSMGLAQQIEYLNKATDGNKSEMLKLLNNNSTAFKTFEALSGSLKNYKGNLDSIGHSQGTTAQSFATASSGFNFAMQKLQASGQTLLITIGMQLLPVLTRIVTAVTPIVSSFSQWLVQSGALKNAVSFLVGAFTNLVNVGSALVSFFQHNQVAMAALQAILITVAGVIVVSMVVAFYAWATAAAAAAIATIAATWPILLIGVVVALVVMGIILAVRNWGAIAHWLQGIWAAVLGWLSGAWGAFSGWFMGLLHGIGAFFVGVWNGIVSGLRAAWNFIVQVVRIGAQLLLLAVFGPIIGIIKLFEFLYNHNYYFKNLVDSIRNIISAGLAWLQSAWSASIAWLAGLWHGAVGIATGAWQATTGAISAAANAAWAFLVSVWTTASSWLADKWNQFSTLASNAWQAVSRVFSSVWGTYISGPLTSLGNSISNFFTGIVSQATSWGSNIIQGFINGIRSQIGAAGQAAQDVINNVKNFLGFHSPAKMGPGAELMSWGPGLVKGFSEGMLKALPTLDAAVNITANHLTPLAAPAPRAVGASQSQGRGVTVNHYHTYQINTMARSRSEISRFVDMMEQEQGKRVRKQTAGYSSGGIW